MLKPGIDAWLLRFTGDGYNVGENCRFAHQDTLLTCKVSLGCVCGGGGISL